MVDVLEAAKYLESLQEKAKEKILGAVKIENTIVDAIVVYSKHDLINKRVEYLVKFKLNGTEHQIEGFLDNSTISREDIMSKQLYHDQIVALFYKRLSEIIAELIVKNSSKIFQDFQKIV